jgi:hypothetical protein
VLVTQVVQRSAQEPSDAGEVEIEIHRYGAVTTAGGVELVGLEFETVWVVEVAGPAGVAPLSRPCEAGSK